MQVLIYKSELNELAENHWPRGMAPGDSIDLRIVEDGVIEACATEKARLWMRRPRRVRLGTLNEQASKLLDHAVRNGAYLRVRIVEIQPAHLALNGQPKVAISVWGDPQGLTSNSDFQQPRETYSPN